MCCLITSVVFTKCIFITIHQMNISLSKVRWYFYSILLFPTFQDKSGYDYGMDRVQIIVRSIRIVPLSRNLFDFEKL